MYGDQSFGDVMSSTSGPKLSSLPQWSRVKTIGHGFTPNVYLKDRYVPIISTTKVIHGESIGNTDLSSSEHSECNFLSMQQKKFDTSISFMQMKHKDLLSNLHIEVDQLKRNNRELQFQLVSLSKSPSSLSASSFSNSKKVKPLIDVISQKENSCLQDTNFKKEELRIIVLEKELEKLKSILNEEKEKNKYLTRIIEKLKKNETRNSNNSQQQMQKLEDGELVESSFSKKRSKYQSELPFKMSMDPLTIEDQENHVTRVPTIEECGLIIKDLIHSKESQTNELNYLRKYIKMLLHGKRSDIEGYMPTDVIILNNKPHEVYSSDKLPSIHLKHYSKPSPSIGNRPKQEVITLPALKQTMGLKAIDRVKKTQQLHKNKNRREILPMNSY